MRRRTFLLTLSVAATAGGCSDSAPRPSASLSPTAGSTSSSATSPSGTARPSGRPAPLPTATDVGTPRVVGTLATGLATPWGMTFLPGGDALVGERDSGRVVRVAARGGVAAVGTVPGVVNNTAEDGETGLLGLATSPDYARDHAVYAFYSTQNDNRVARMTYDAGRLGAPTPILTGIPRGMHHNGGRLVFGPDGMLYASTGEIEDEDLAQDTSSLGGKILRMTTEGKPAPGNPFGNLVYSYGHRDVQGLAFDSAGRLWASEFGDNAWDELNLIRRGGNYGWPTVEGRSDRRGLINPVAQFRPAQCSPSGIAIHDDVVWMAALRGERLYRLPIKGDTVASTTQFFDRTYGRLRTVTAAPDGSLWLATSNRDGRTIPRAADDRILKVTVS